MFFARVFYFVCGDLFWPLLSILPPKSQDSLLLLRSAPTPAADGLATMVADILICDIPNVVAFIHNKLWYILQTNNIFASSKMFG